MDHGLNALNLTITRIKATRNRRSIAARRTRGVIAQLLRSGEALHVRDIKIVSLIKEENTVAAYDRIEQFCHSIVSQFSIIEAQRYCPPQLQEPIASVMYAASRCADLPELTEVKDTLTTKYGKEFAAAANELKLGCGVSGEIVELLSMHSPSEKLRVKLMKEICLQNNIDWESEWASEPSITDSTEDFQISRHDHREMIDGDEGNINIQQSQTGLSRMRHLRTDQDFNLSRDRGARHWRDPVLKDHNKRANVPDWNSMVKPYDSAMGLDHASLSRDQDTPIKKEASGTIKASHDPSAGSNYGSFAPQLAGHEEEARSNNKGGANKPYRPGYTWIHGKGAARGNVQVSEGMEEIYKLNPQDISNLAEDHEFEKPIPAPCGRHKMAANKEGTYEDRAEYTMQHPDEISDSGSDIFVSIEEDDVNLSHREGAPKISKVARNSVQGAPQENTSARLSEETLATKGYRVGQILKPINRSSLDTSPSPYQEPRTGHISQKHYPDKHNQAEEHLFQYHNREGPNNESHEPVVGNEENWVEELVQESVASSPDPSADPLVDGDFASTAKAIAAEAARLAVLNYAKQYSRSHSSSKEVYLTAEHTEDVMPHSIQEGNNARDNSDLRMEGKGYKSNRPSKITHSETPNVNIKLSETNASSAEKINFHLDNSERHEAVNWESLPYHRHKAPSFDQDKVDKGLMSRIPTVHKPKEKDWLDNGNPHGSLNVQTSLDEKSASLDGQLKWKSTSRSKFEERLAFDQQAHAQFHDTSSDSCSTNASKRPFINEEQDFTKQRPVTSKTNEGMSDLNRQPQSASKSTPEGSKNSFEHVPYFDDFELAHPKEMLRREKSYRSSRHHLEEPGRSIAKEGDDQAHAFRSHQMIHKHSEDSADNEVLQARWQREDAIGMLTQQEKNERPPSSVRNQHRPQEHASLTNKFYTEYGNKNGKRYSQNEQDLNLEPLNQAQGQVDDLNNEVPSKPVSVRYKPQGLQDYSYVQANVQANEVHKEYKPLANQNNPDPQAKHPGKLDSLPAGKKPQQDESLRLKAYNAMAHYKDEEEDASGLCREHFHKPFPMHLREEEQKEHIQYNIEHKKPTSSTSDWPHQDQVDSVHTSPYHATGPPQRKPPPLPRRCQPKEADWEQKDSMHGNQKQQEVLLREEVTSLKQNHSQKLNRRTMPPTRPPPPIPSLQPPVIAATERERPKQESEVTPAWASSESPTWPPSFSGSDVAHKAPSLSCKTQSPAHVLSPPKPAPSKMGNVHGRRIPDPAFAALKKPVQLCHSESPTWPSSTSGSSDPYSKAPSLSPSSNVRSSAPALSPTTPAQSKVGNVHGKQNPYPAPATLKKAVQLHHPESPERPSSPSGSSDPYSIARKAPLQSYKTQSSGPAVSPPKPAHWRICENPSGSNPAPAPAAFKRPAQNFYADSTTRQSDNPRGSNPAPVPAAFKRPAQIFYAESTTRQSSSSGSHEPHNVVRKAASPASRTQTSGPALSPTKPAHWKISDVPGEACPAKPKKPAQLPHVDEIAANLEALRRARGRA